MYERIMTIFPRDRYLNQLTSFHGSELVRVITGMRRSGKSSLLKLYRDWLISEKKIEEKNIVYINFESQILEPYGISAPL